MNNLSLLPQIVLTLSLLSAIPWVIIRTNINPYLSFLIYFIVIVICATRAYGLAIDYRSTGEYVKYKGIEPNERQKLERQLSVMLHKARLNVLVIIKKHRELNSLSYNFKDRSYILIPDGLSLSEQAGVIAHEIGHIIAGDGVRVRVLSALSFTNTLLTITLSLSLGFSGHFLYAIALGLLLFTFTKLLQAYAKRTTEIMADIICTKLGYGEDFLLCLESRSKDSQFIISLFRPHPNFEARAKIILRTMDK